MIAKLNGRLGDLTPESAVVDVGGVGYLVHVPLSTYYELESSGVGATVELYVHTHVREDQLALFGFSTPRERALFERLIAVSGIGPRLARVALSGMEPDELVRALAAGDVARLSTIPGVGKKTAERMVLELRDKVAELAVEPAEPPPPSADEDLVTALVNLGYKRAAAERAVAQVSRELPEAEIGELLRAALKSLAKL